MMDRWSMTDVQAEAILNMRLRSLRRLEEVGIKKEHKALTAEQKDLEGLLAKDDRRWSKIADEIRDVRERFGVKAPGGKRRTEITDVPNAIDVPMDAVIEREPVTIICSQKGWIRAIRGHLDDVSDIKFKDGDRGRYVLRAQTTDKLVAFGTNGRFYTLACGKLPGGRGHGEPIRLMIDLGNDQDIVRLMVHEPGRKLLVAASDGRGFIVAEDEVLAQTKSGKQVLNLSGGTEAQACVPVAGESVAVVGSNRKLVIFPVDELPEMTRGRGVIMQRFKDGGLADVSVFALDTGLSWRSGERMRTEMVLEPWIGKRASAGRLVPKGFPRSNRFD
jgi:topoisomerase-4 subunit A